MSTVCSGPGTVLELSREHGALVRRLAALQQHLDDLLCGHARQVNALEVERMRLRAQVVLLRTASLWGLGAVQMPSSSPPARLRTQPPLAAETLQAQAVICQTGCAGHAHPWLADDGLCRRSGQVCERLGRPETT